MKVTRRGIFGVLFGLPLAARAAPKKTTEKIISTTEIFNYEPVVSIPVNIPPGDHELVLVPGVPGRKIQIFSFGLVAENLFCFTLYDGQNEHIFSSPLLMNREAVYFSYPPYAGFVVDEVKVRSSGNGKLEGYLTYCVFMDEER